MNKYVFFLFMCIISSHTQAKISNSFFLYEEVVDENRTFIEYALNYFPIDNSDNPDSEPPTVPTNLTTTSTSQTTTNLLWDAATDNIAVTGYNIYRGATLYTTTTTTSHLITGLAPNTSYTFKIAAIDDAGNQSQLSNTLNVITQNDQLFYCVSTSNSANDEYISRVQLANIDHASGAQIYSDFTNITTNLTKGTQHTIAITPSWTGVVYDEAYAVWIDYNNDGDFTDANELVWNQESTQASIVSGSFIIPSTVTNGATRMRISMKYNAIPISCEVFSYGEVEDYTVNILPEIPDSEAPILTLVGNSIIDLFVGDSYIELSATALDNVDGNLTDDIVINGTVNTFIPGVYTITYDVTDSSQNEALQVIRTVNVIMPLDTTAPLMALLENSTITITIGNSYIEYGAVARDNIDGDLTDAIIISGNVDTQVAGVYTITYNVSDSAGNAALELTRTVYVEERVYECSNEVKVFPYFEGFEGSLNIWEQSVADNLDWKIDADGTPSRNTGPSSAREGSYYAYVEASGNDVGYPNKQAILTSPCFDLSSESSAIFNFNYHIYGSTDMGIIYLEIRTKSNPFWSPIWNRVGNQDNAWKTASIDLSAYLGNSIQLRFNRITGSTWQADIAIDNINLITNTQARAAEPNVSENFKKTIKSKSKLIIYPNPVKETPMRILFENKKNEDKVSYNIKNIYGQIVKKGKTQKEITMNDLKSGIYFLEVINDGVTYKKKFIKE